MSSMSITATISSLLTRHLYPRSVSFTSGCDNVACASTAGFGAAKTAASAADAVVLILGLDQSQEKEGHDRESIAFPGNQVALAQQVGGSCMLRWFQG